MGKEEEQNTDLHMPAWAPDDLDDAVDTLMQQSLIENDAVYRELGEN